jgi:FHA domain
MTDQLLGVLKIVFLVLLYAFFARVLWAVWSEVRVPALPHAALPVVPTDDTKIKRRHRVTELRVVAPKNIKGTRLEISATPQIIGRSDEAALSIADDTFLSNRHARVWLANGQAMIEDLQSTNGTKVNDQPISAPTTLRPGDRITMGHIVVEAER